MYSYEERMRAVRLFLKCDKSRMAVINELGYPSRVQLMNWYREYNKACTDLFFHIVDARSEKDGLNLVLMTSNFTADKWDECFTGGSTLLCTLDRLFDDATVLMIKGSSFRGQGLETYSVETAPSVSKAPTTR